MGAATGDRTPPGPTRRPIGAGSIVKEKIPAAPDTDTSTRQTIQKMCEYIRAGVEDPMCQWWAAQAREKWAGGAPVSPAAQACWGVWWLVKHAVKFAKDEPRLFQVGEPEALDLLIAPGVLVREPAPKEDCDGFTMLVCCLLQILGISSVIVTVAADPSDPERWSHVFPMAKIGGQNMPMDCSHGKFPGWMVPREHIFRWQAWDLNGNPVQEFPSAMKNTLHGYMPQGSRIRRGVAMRAGRHRGMRGLGQDDGSYTSVSSSSGDYQVFSDGTVFDPNGNIVTDFSTLPTSVTNSINSALGITSTPSGVNPLTTPGITNSSTVSTPTSSSSSSSSGSSTNLTSVLNSLITGGLKAAQLATLPAGYTINPANGQLVYTGQALATAQLTSSFAGVLPWLAIGAVALIVLPLVIGKK